MAKEERNAMTLKHIGVLSAGKVLAIFGVIFGFLSAVLSLTLRSMLVKTAANNPVYAQMPQVQAMLAVPASYWSLIIAPIEVAIIYFLTGIIGSWLYNIIAGWIGGIELHFSK